MKGRRIYKTYAEARAAARALNFKNFSDYRKNYRKDPYLTFNPARDYPDFISYSDFLGCREHSRGKLYSYDEAAEIVQNAGVMTKSEYESFQENVLRLPRAPNIVYADRWSSWNDFFDYHPK